MSSNRKSMAESEKVFPKCASGIRGLDEITFGGLPKGRPTLIAGGAGSGKTLMSMEFLVHGAVDYNEPVIQMGIKAVKDQFRKRHARFS